MVARPVQVRSLSDTSPGPVARRDRILDRLRTAGNVLVGDLALDLATSEMTIRRDLKLLETEGLVRRVHGGALLVPSRAIGFIEPGSRVVLRYQAFPYQKFGQQYGRVTDISRSALSPPDIAALMGQQAQQQEPLYRIQVKLDSQQISVYGKPEPVKPGMALEADILMERRRLIEWVFEPLYGVARHLAGDAAHG